MDNPMDIDTDPALDRPAEDRQMFVTPEPGFDEDEFLNRSREATSVRQHGQESTTPMDIDRNVTSADEDLMIIAEEDLPSGLREQWSQSRSSSTTAFPARVKVEPKEEPQSPQEVLRNANPSPRQQDVPASSRNQNILARQQRLMAGFAARNELRGRAATATPSVQNRAPSQRPAQGGAGPANSNMSFGQTETLLMNEGAELDRLIRQNHGEDDDAWMYEESNSTPYEETSQKIDSLKSAKAALELKERRGKSKFTQADRIQLIQVTNQLKELTRRYQLARRMRSGDEERPASNGDDSDETVVNSTEPNQAQDEQTRELLERLYQDDNRNKADKSASGRKKGSNSSKPRKPRNKTARDVQQFRLEKEQEKERKKRERQKKRTELAASKSTKSKKNAGKAGKKADKSAKAKKPSRPRMINGWGNGLDDPMLDLLANLVNDDMIQNRVDQGDYDEAPEIRASNKGDQLDQLCANAPADYDVHRRRTTKRVLLDASKTFGHGAVKAVDGKWLLRGMKTSLYNHQLLAAEWMVGRELSETPPFGGLLADAMGLGKTVEMLATMIGNPPALEDIQKGRSSTLIVVPASVIRQWQDEITLHVENKTLKDARGKKVQFPMVMHYKASGRLPIEVIQCCDIVITSYAEVLMSFPVPTKNDLAEIKNTSYQDWLDRTGKQRGILHDIKWYRVVLDEAHAIKNHRSQTSIACHNLDAKYRWAMSGTPIQNRLQELYPYFRFLRAQWTDDYDQFSAYFCDPDAEDDNARIDVVLSMCMMRRTMRDRILGRPIIELPPIHPETKFIEFSGEETVIYRLLETRFRELLNLHFRRRTAERNYGFFMVQLLRLRQCTAHPFLLEQTFKDIFNLQHLAKLQSSLEAVKRKQGKAPLFEQIKLWLQRPPSEGGEANDAVQFGRSNFGSTFEMDKFLQTMDERKAFETVVCRLCGDLPRSPQITDCKCIFCKECLDGNVHAQVASTERSDVIVCPSCDKVFLTSKPYDDLKFRDEDDSEGSSSPNGSQNGNRRRGRNNDEEFTGASSNSVKNATWLRMCKRGEADLLPSAKMIALKAMILKWIDEAPGDKILIFTQFRVVAQVIGMICTKENWKFLYFQGDMNQHQRHNAITKFHTDPSIKIMIAGLKCGGVALNLTCANRCISIDLWWNHCVEQQAFGRIFRIGQKKESYVTRFVVKNTVDARMLGMQADKVQTIDRAMQDTGSAVAPLSMTDLAQLFGHLRKGADGYMEVVADYDDEVVGEGEGGEGATAAGDGAGGATSGGGATATAGGDATATAAGGDASGSGATTGDGGATATAGADASGAGGSSN